jgi:hypothetical protein
MVMVLGSTSTTDGPVIPEWGYYDNNWLETDLEWLQGIAEDGSLFCTIDGTPVQNLKDYVFSGALPHTVDFDLGVKVTFDSAIVCSLLLKPLTPGRHTIYLEWFGAPFLTYNITVTPVPPVSKGQQ